MRIEINIRDDDPVASTIHAIPAGERGPGLRAIIRLHAGEIPGLLGLARAEVVKATAAALRPFDAAPDATALAAVEPKAPPADRAAMARRLVKLGSRCTKAVAGFAVVGALAFGLPRAAQAAEPAGQGWTLDVNVASVHTEAWARHSLNQINPGIGVTHHWSRTWAGTGGVYRGSYRRPVYYGQLEYTPLHAGSVGHWHVDAGLMAGVATYTHREVACAPFAAAALVRITAPDGIGANVVMVPNQGAHSTGFIGLQISVPLH